MNKPSSFILMVFLLLLVLPIPTGKFIINLAGGIFLVITAIPLILGGIGWLAWKRIQSKVQTCQNCGSSFLSSQITCPVCGENMQYDKDNFDNIPASSATIDIKSENID